MHYCVIYHVIFMVWRYEERARQFHLGWLLRAGLYLREGARFSPFVMKLKFGSIYQRLLV